MLGDLMQGLARKLSKLSEQLVEIVIVMIDMMVK